MKKAITLVSVLALGVVVGNAQITVNSSDIAGIGSMYYMTTDTFTSYFPGAINPGPAGANKTWNFFTQLLDGKNDTVNVTNPAWTPQGANFPGSNMAIVHANGNTDYLQNNSTGLYLVGMYVDTSVILYVPKDKQIGFPDTYNSSFQITSQYDVTVPFFFGIDSLRLKEVKTEKVVTDGWGKIITPLGTFNCLRSRSREITIDSTWFITNVPPMTTFGGVAVDTVWHFSWRSNTIGLPLLEFDSLKGDSVINITWLKSLPLVSEVHENASLKGVSVYPNPSIGKFMVSIPNAATASVYNSCGKNVLPAIVKESKEFFIDLSAQPTGIYFIRITSDEGIVTRKLVLDK